MDLEPMLFSGEEHDAADFGEPKRRANVQGAKDAFDGHSIWNELFHEPGEKSVNFAESGCGGLFKAGRGTQRAVMKRAAVPSVAFDDAVAGGACCRRIYAQNAHTKNFQSDTGVDTRFMAQV